MKKFWAYDTHPASGFHSKIDLCVAFKRDKKVNKKQKSTGRTPKQYQEKCSTAFIKRDAIRGNV